MLSASRYSQCPLSVIVVGMAVLMGCYEALGPSEVLVVSRRGKLKVVRGGAFIFPLMSWTTRVNLRPMWIEFPKDAKGDVGAEEAKGDVSAGDAKGDESAIPNRENRLITEDGLPVTTRVAILIEVGNDDTSILNVARNFSDSSDSQIRDHFTK